MTLAELIDQCRSSLIDESVQVRRSWEEMFTYTMRHFARDTDLQAFDPRVLSDRLATGGMNQLIADGYLNRWNAVLANARDRHKDS